MAANEILSILCIYNLFIVNEVWLLRNVVGRYQYYLFCAHLYGLSSNLVLRYELWHWVALVEVQVLEHHWLNCFECWLVFDIGVIDYYVLFTLRLLACSAIICHVLRQDGVKLGRSTTLCQSIGIGCRIVGLLGHFLPIIWLGCSQKRVESLILLGLLIWCHLGGLLEALGVCG